MYESPVSEHEDFLAKVLDYLLKEVVPHSELPWMSLSSRVPVAGVLLSQPNAIQSLRLCLESLTPCQRPKKVFFLAP